MNTKIALIQKKSEAILLPAATCVHGSALECKFCSPPAEPPGSSRSSNPVTGSRARLASRRWRPFLTIKARQNALATNFAAGKFPCLRAFPTPCPSAGFVNILRSDRRFRALAKLATAKIAPIKRNRRQILLPASANLHPAVTCVHGSAHGCKLASRRRSRPALRNRQTRSQGRMPGL